MRVTAATLAIGLVALTARAQATAPDESALLAAWEAAQRGDPKTTAFERLGERRYRFATSRFPFDGELVVLNLCIDTVAVGDEPATTGVVEVELIGVDDRFRQRFAHSYGAWAATQQFYWDETAGRWVDWRAWGRQLQERALRGLGSGGGLGGWASRNLFWVLFLALLVVLLGVFARRANRQMKAAMAAQEVALAQQRQSIELVERSLALGEDSNRVLHGILEELRRRQP